MYDTELTNPHQIKSVIQIQNFQFLGSEWLSKEDTNLGIHFVGLVTFY